MSISVAFDRLQQDQETSTESLLALEIISKLVLAIDAFENKRASVKSNTDEIQNIPFKPTCSNPQTA